MKVDAFPLQWPSGWKRNQSRKQSRFNTSFAKARDELFNELKLMGIGNWNVILSTNIPLRRDGLPYAGQANPQDPGVAVYFKYKGRDMVFACDTYKSVADNLQAVNKTIEALRGISRWGASDMMERSFTGFQALAAPPEENWWDVLGLPETTGSLDKIKKAWKEKAMEFHPDKGGSQEQMAKINAAYEQAMSEFKE